MIPNALACTGYSAGLWTELKSINYALSWVLSSDQRMKLSLLIASASPPWRSFLLAAVDTSIDIEPTSSLILDSKEKAQTFTFPDLRRRLEGVTQFVEWKKNLGFERKLSRLSEKLLLLVASATDTVFVKNIPREEFVILDSIVKALLSEAEAALHG